MWIYKDKDQDKKQDMIGYVKIKWRICEDKIKDIYEEIAGHKGYKRMYTKISCVEEDILTYHKQISFDIHDYIHSKVSFHTHNTYPSTYSY
jgi:hypothetical protein